MLAHKVNHRTGVSVYVTYIAHNRFRLLPRTFLHDLRRTGMYQSGTHR